MQKQSLSLLPALFHNLIGPIWVQAIHGCQSLFQRKKWYDKRNEPEVAARDVYVGY